MQHLYEPKSSPIAPVTLPFHCKKPNQQNTKTISMSAQVAIKIVTSSEKLATKSNSQHFLKSLYVLSTSQEIKKLC